MNKQREDTKQGAGGWRSAPIGKDKKDKKAQITAAGTILLMGLAVILLVAVIGLVLMPLANEAESFAEFTRLITPAHTFLVVLILIFLVPLTLVFILTLRRMAGKDGTQWRAVDAVCHEHQLLPVVNYTEEGEIHGWSYRLRCSYKIGDQTYEVTPHGHNGHHFELFESQDAAIKFLMEHIEENGTCRLLVDRDSPNQARLMTGEG